ncbi:MAG: aminoacyl-tRNA hydrolase [Treponema sp.]|jgi:PTH1 family peptidyl-tRNA hydrolase|nr:aminoacyl-tRNA hydrolase [Treponema sp.]
MVDLVVFLGNPGRQYARNRHNAGWLFAEALPFYSSLSWQKKYKGLYGTLDSSRLPSPGLPSPGGGSIEGELPPAGSRKLHFLKPETFMNLSGEAVSAAAGFLKIAVESVLVVHDELELPLGTVSLKFGGGLGGHNGLRSMKASLADAGFWRLRFGIGRPDDRAPGQGGPPGSGRGIIDWVLSNFSPSEETMLEQIFARTNSAFIGALVRGPETLLPLWGKRRVFEES